jgi:hypothetical protein
VRTVILDGVGLFTIPEQANLVATFGGVFELKSESTLTL